jgi:two-component system response regulator (stage 0 sporulation protein F)
MEFRHPSGWPMGLARDTHEAPSPRILVAEDDDEMRLLLAWSLRWEGYEVTQCRNGIELLDALGEALAKGDPNRIALVISDIRMPEISGLQILRGLGRTGKFPPMILITAFGDDETHAAADRLGAAAFFDKPFQIDNLMAKVREILRHRRAAGENGDAGENPNPA